MGYEEVKYRWTTEDWASAASAKKAKDAGTDPLPKILVTPYGLSPFQFFTSGVEAQKVVIKARVYLASDTTDKKPLAAWDIAADTEVMLPLELANFGQPGLRDQFYKKGQEWIPKPDKATGSTLLELCRSLYATKEPRFDIYHFFSDDKPDGNKKTDAELAADGVVRDRVLRKLVGHWKNTDYHYEQVKGAFAVNGSLALPLNSKTLNVVLCEPPPPPDPKPAVPGGDQGAGAAIKVGTTALGGSPPPPPYDQLPDPLKATLIRSYQDRKDGVPGSETNLSAYFDKGANTWEAINKGMSWQDINTMVRVYQRMEAVDKSGALWRDHMKYFIRAYSDGIYAMELVYTDREKLKPYLDEITLRNDTPQLANASGFYQCMHSGTVGWREVSSTDQLHISVQDGTDPTAGEDCHIDETSFTEGRDASGTAIHTDWGTGIKHFTQSKLRWIDIERPFAKLDEMLQKPEDQRPLMLPEMAAELQAWTEKRACEAVSGETGHGTALDLLHRINKGAEDLAASRAF